MYALGEIVLIVIGIMIALQADNLNEKRKRQKELSLLFQNTSEFLEPSIHRDKMLIPHYQQIDSVFQRMATLDSPQFYKDNPEIRNFLYSDTLVFPLKKYYWVSPGIKSLIQAKTDFQESHKPLIYDLENWDLVNEELEKVNQDFINEIRSFQNQLLNHAPFLFETGQTMNDRSIDYLMNDPWFRFKMKFLANQSRDVLRVLHWNRASLAELFGQIRVSEFHEGVKELDSVFRVMGLTPLERISQIPQTDSQQDEDRVNPYIIFYNRRNSIVEVRHLQGNEEISRSRIAPKSTAIRRYNSGTVISIDQPDRNPLYFRVASGRYGIIE
ncbi:hypothetical protein GCM10011361_16570 [Muriicola marianensis]|uniref:Uncharacterized protein n=1 Tax=Muriicola marianensis TaxID=1324801 RepID=A0ABQ1QX71_9FLAO|nr:hypothetical protein GCM10011361_16570 [Muriicola marianensis]